MTLDSSKEETPNIGEGLSQALASTGEDETVRAILLMEDQPDVESLAAQHPTKASLLDALKVEAQQTQMPVQTMITGLQSADEVTESTSLWLLNAIAVEGTADAIEKLAGAPGVGAAVEDGELKISSHTEVTIEEVDEEETRDERIPSATRAEELIGQNLEIPERPQVDLDELEAVETPDQIPVEAADHAGFGVFPGDGDEFAWGMERVYAPSAHAQGLTGDGVNVAVIDTGIDGSHPDLEVTDFKDFINDFSTPYDDNGHGTHVAGTVAGSNATGTGLNTGVAPDANLIGVKALDSTGAGLLSTIVQAIEWSVENDADVISMSLGGPHTDVVHSALENAADADVLPVAAAGNGAAFERDSFAVNVRDLLPVLDPGHERDVLTVGATFVFDRVDVYSAYDEDLEDEEGTYDKPEVVAPGTRVTSTIPGGGYDDKTGTSMAAPHVAGIAALVLEQQDMPPSAVKQTITDTAEDITPDGRDRVSGHGLANARAAWVAQNGGHDLEHTAEVHQGTLFLNATLTDADGDPVSGEDVTFNTIAINSTWLTIGKLVPSLYLAEGVQATTNNTGVATTTVPFETDLDAGGAANNGTYTSEATAFGNLTSDTDTFTESEIADVDVSVDQHSKAARENVTVTVDVTEPDSSSPLDAQVEVVLVSRTLRDTTMAMEVNTTSTNPAQATFTLPDWAEFYAEDGFGSWEIATVVEDVNLTDGWMSGLNTSLQTNPNDVQIDIFPDQFDTRIPWTDMEIKDGRDVEFVLSDIVTWQGQLAAGETFNGTLTTTEDNDVFDLWLADGPADDQIIDTIDISSGESFQTTIPSSHAGGTYLLLAVPTGQCSDADSDGSLDFSGECSPGTANSIGEWDASLVSIRALSASIDFIQQTDGGETLEPGEEIMVRVEFNDPVTGDPVDPAGVFISASGMSVPSASVGDGLVEFNAELSQNAFAVPTVTASGTDQNGGTFSLVFELGILEPFRTSITPEENSYEAGEDATFTVSASYPESGEPIANADVDFAVVGQDPSSSWTKTGTVTTDDFGQAEVDVRIPADATQISSIPADVLLVAVPQKSDQTGVAISGFEIIEEFPEPRLSVNAVSQEVGLFGLLGIPVIQPGDSLAMEVEAKGVDASQLEDNDLYADVFAVKISVLNGPATLGSVADLGATKLDAVHLGDDGKGTHTISVDEHAPPGLYVILGLAEMNGRQLVPQTVDDFTLGIVGSGHGLDVQAPDVLGGGEDLEVGVSGELPAGAEIDLFLERKNGTAQFPTLSTPNGLGEIDLIVEQTASAASNQTDVLADELEANLPDDLSVRSDEVVSAFEKGATPLIASMISADGPGGPMHVGSVQASEIDTTEDLSVNMTLPQNVPPGDYQVVAKASSDDRVTLPVTYGFADLEIQNALQTVREFEIDLSTGWNLVSVPVDEEVSVDTIEAATDGAIMKTIRWQPGLSSYEPADTLEPGLGYWVFSAEDTSFTVEGVSLDEKDLAVDDRWRLYGSVGRTAGLDNALTSPSDLTIHAVGWNAADGDYETLSKVAPGQGFWLVASEPGELHLKAPPAPP